LCSLNFFNFIGLLYLQILYLLLGLIGTAFCCFQTDLTAPVAVPTSFSLF
jgi:hypothetical protein